MANNALTLDAITKTIESFNKMNEAVRKAQESIGHLSNFRIVESPYLEDTIEVSVKIFKRERKGKRKIWVEDKSKKLFTLKRVPSTSVYVSNDAIICHPILAAKLKESLGKNDNISAPYL